MFKLEILLIGNIAPLGKYKSFPSTLTYNTSPVVLEIYTILAGVSAFNATYPAPVVTLPLPAIEVNTLNID